MPGSVLGFGNRKINKTESLNSKQSMKKDRYISYLQCNVVMFSVIGLVRAMESRKMEDSSVRQNQGSQRQLLRTEDV